MSKKVNVIIIRSAGTNCDQETQFAFEDLSANVDLVHINQLFQRKKHLDDYHILAIPGGFTYGDDIASGKIFANELRLKLADDLKKFIHDGKLIIGICNGFQILVKAGILPGTNGLNQTTTLTTNDSGKFEDRWVHLKPGGHSVWTKGINRVVTLPVAHGEGKFIPQDDGILKKIQDGGQVVFRYCNETGQKPDYPENPNGSIDDIAGICDATGRVFGLMPHPERHFFSTQHPRWTRLHNKEKYGDGAAIFRSGIHYAEEKLL